MDGKARKARIGALGLTLALYLPVFPAVPSVSLLAVARAPRAALHAQEPSFRTVSSELVVLPVVVTDKRGQYVSDLSTDRFMVFDNGRRVPIELFSNEDTPVTVGLVIDASSSMRPKIGEVVAATMAFARASNPQDELFAIHFNDDVIETVSHRRFLLADDLGPLEAAVTSIRPDGRTALYDGIMAALDHLAVGSRPRKALIVISDGGDNASSATLDVVLKRARDSNAAIYTIGVFNDDDMDKNPKVLKALAETTGAERFLPRSPGELLRSCAHIAREIRSGYTIGYVPPDRDGGYHRVRVQIEPSAPQRLIVRTRPGYFASGRAVPQ
jgi:Ca-activated chloride channel family protein